jgi:hypothetical protein
MFCFKYVPLWQRYYRYTIFSTSDALVNTYGAGEAAQKIRTKTEESAKEYIYATAPKKYHDILVPQFPLGECHSLYNLVKSLLISLEGCKRRIFDPGYLRALHSKNMALAPEGISEIDETSITSESGAREEFDVIVLATGFEVTDFLGPLKITGKNGIDLHQQWNEHVGAQAYLGMHVHNFPNFAMM